MATVQSLMQYIAQMEGFGANNNRASRNNNPGNLKYAGQANAIGKDAQGFAVFGSVQDGWAALERQIALDQNRGLSLREFIYKYAPPSENNTTNYLSYISSNLGIAADAPLSSLNILQSVPTTQEVYDSYGLDTSSNQNIGVYSAGLLDNLLGDWSNEGWGVVTPLAIGLGVIGILAIVLRK